MPVTTVMQVDIRHRMANVILNDLDLNRQGQTFKFSILTNIAIAKDRKSDIGH